MTVKGTEECTICVAPKSQNYVFYSDGEKASLCQVVMTDQVKQSKEFVFFEDENVQYGSSG